MRPVSITMRRQSGAFANSPAIASAVDAVLLSRTTIAFAVDNTEVGLIH